MDGLLTRASGNLCLPFFFIDDIFLQRGGHTDCCRPTVLIYLHFSAHTLQYLEPYLSKNGLYIAWFSPLHPTMCNNSGVSFARRMKLSIAFLYDCIPPKASVIRYVVCALPLTSPEILSHTFVERKKQNWQEKRGEKKQNRWRIARNLHLLSL